MVNVDIAVEGWWSKEWGTDELEDESLAPVSLWEAEVAALSDEQLASMQDQAEDL
jgi:hypothetical protein